MSFEEKIFAVLNTRAAMDSSKLLCLDDAKRLASCGKMDYAEQRLEKAAQYAWGCWRPDGWDLAGDGR
jgi:hypothetical protein